MTMNCKSFLTTIAGIAVIAFTFGCTPPKTDVDTSTDTGAETSSGGTSSNVTEAIETPDNNTTTGSETPAGETP